MDSSCSTYGVVVNVYTIWSENLKGRGHSECLGVDEIHGGKLRTGFTKLHLRCCNIGLRFQ